MREKIKQFMEFLEGLPMTIVGGVALILSFILPRINNFTWQNLIHWHYYYRGRLVHGGAEIWENLAWITILICGLPLLYLAIYRLIHNKGLAKISSCLLISIAMFACLYFGDLFAAGEVAFIMALGAILEDMTTKRARKGLEKLISLAPVQGRRILPDGKEELVPAQELRAGDIVRVLPGETIPVDGSVFRGETSIDQSVMTGESLPVDKVKGDEVFCGTLNCYGSIDITASRTGNDSSLQHMIRLVREAEEKQAPVQRLADRWASILVPVALLISIAAWLITGQIDRMVTVMVVFCPCALVLDTPTAVMAAIGQATKHGIIIKSGEALERLGKIQTIAFDKTGTLTSGRLAVSDLIPLNLSETGTGISDDSSGESSTENALLSLAASAEDRSEHPLGKAITACARERKLSWPAADSFKMYMGKGIEATVAGNTVLCGNERFLTDRGIVLPDQALTFAKQLQSQGKAVIMVVRDGITAGIIALSDTIRPEAKNMIEKLSKLNVNSVLLTGDHPSAAKWIASQTGITEIHSELLPEDKVTLIQELQKKTPVCMIGDGVNDAPALKTADTGVAMGCMGSDIAIEAADVALMTDDISRIPYLKQLSNATVRTIRTCITISMCINATAVTLSVLGKLNPTTGALVHNVGSTFVVLMAALLYDRKFK